MHEVNSYKGHLFWGSVPVRKAHHGDTAAGVSEQRAVSELATETSPHSACGKEIQMSADTAF